MIILSNVVDVQYLNLPLVQVCLHWRSSFFFSSLWACTFLSAAERSLVRRRLNSLYAAGSSTNPEQHSVPGQSVTCSVVFGTEEERKRRTPSCLSCEEPVASGRSFARSYRKLKDKLLLFGSVFQEKIEWGDCFQTGCRLYAPDVFTHQKVVLERLYNVHFLKIQIYKSFYIWLNTNVGLVTS